MSLHFYTLMSWIDRSWKSARGEKRRSLRTCHSRVESLEGREVPATFNIVDYGATANDTTDDTVAIQAAINAARDTPGADTVVIPNGTFLVSVNQFDRYQPILTLHPSLTLEGNDRTASILKLKDGSGNYQRFFGASVFDGDLSNLTINRLKVDFNSAGNPISGESAFWPTGLARWGLLYGRGSNVSVINSHFTNHNGVWVLSFDPYLSPNSTQIQNVTVSNNIFDRIGGSTGGSYDHSSVYTNTTGAVITNNSFSTLNGPGTLGGTTAIEIHGNQQVVTDNSIYGYYTGVNVTGSAATSSNDQLYARNTITGAAMGFQVWVYKAGGQTIPDPALQRVVIRDNTVRLDLQPWRYYFVGSYDTQYDGRGGIAWNPAHDSRAVELDIINNDILFTNSVGGTSFSDEDTAGVSFAATSFNATYPVHSKIRILGNRIENSPGAGVYTDLSVSGLEVAGNTIVNSGRSVFAISNFYRAGVHIGQSTTNASPFTTSTITGASIVNNVITDNQAVATTKYGVVDNAKSTGTNSAARNTITVAAGATPPVFATGPDRSGPAWVTTVAPLLNLSRSQASGYSSTASATVNLSASSTQTITVQYTVNSATPASLAESNFATGTVTFTPGQTSRPISFTVPAGLLAKPGTVLEIRLAWPTNAYSGVTSLQKYTILSNPAGHYRFDGNGNDSSGNGKTITLTGAPGYTTGRFGQALNLNGTSQFASRAALVNTSQSYSVSTWVYWTGSNGNYQHAVSQDGTNVSAFFLGYNVANNRWEFTTTASDSTSAAQASVLSTAAPSVNTWVNLVGVYDATAGKIRLYVNGQLAGESNSTGAWNAMGSTVVGASKWAGARSFFFNGRVDDTRLFQKPLSQAEISALFIG